MNNVTILKLFIFFLCCISLSACGRDNRGIVVGKIQKASKLATTEFTIDKLVHGTKTKKIAWFFKLNEASFLAYSQAKVKTGINLKKLKREDIFIEGTTIEVTLPTIEVLNFSYPPEKFRMDKRISEPKKFLNSISLEDQEQFFREAEMDIRKSLKYMGIVETTQDKTRALLMGLLRSLGYEEIHIGFKSDDLIIQQILTEQEN